MWTAGTSENFLERPQSEWHHYSDIISNENSKQRVIDTNWFSIAESKNNLPLWTTITTAGNHHLRDDLNALCQQPHTVIDRALQHVTILTMIATKIHCQGVDKDSLTMSYDRLMVSDGLVCTQSIKFMAQSLWIQVNSAFYPQVEQTAHWLQCVQFMQLTIVMLCLQLHTRYRCPLVQAMNGHVESLAQSQLPVQFWQLSQSGYVHIPSQ